jgi:hypothetical protein
MSISIVVQRGIEREPKRECGHQVEEQASKLAERQRGTADGGRQ